MEKKESNGSRPSYGQNNAVKRLSSQEQKPVSNKDIFGAAKKIGLREQKPEERQPASYTYKRDEPKVATSKYQVPAQRVER